MANNYKNNNYGDDDIKKKAFEFTMMNTLHQCRLGLKKLNLVLNPYAQLRAAKKEILRERAKGEAAAAYANAAWAILAAIGAEMPNIEREFYKKGIDQLTQLRNRESYIEAFDLEILLASRAISADPLTAAVLFFDLDNFKQVNDLLGHPMGDLALTAVAAQIKKVFNRRVDICGRYGGEELVVAFMSPKSKAVAEAQKRAEIARVLIKENCNIWADGTIGPVIDRNAEPVRDITASVGIAIFTPSDIDPKTNLEDARDACMARADAGLYEAKRRGRNCVVFVGSEEEAARYRAENKAREFPAHNVSPRAAPT